MTDIVDTILEEIDKAIKDCENLNMYEEAEYGKAYIEGLKRSKEIIEITDSMHSIKKHRK